MMERESQRAVLWSQKDRRNTNQPLFSNEFQMNGVSGEYPRTGPAIAVVGVENNEEDEMLMGSRKKEESKGGSGGVSDEEAPMFHQGVNH
jgi:hypothetical protein